MEKLSEAHFKEQIRQIEQEKRKDAKLFYILCTHRASTYGFAFEVFLELQSFLKEDPIPDVFVERITSSYTDLPVCWETEEEYSVAKADFFRNQLTPSVSSSILTV